jgi:hypothetical protein
LVLRSFDGPNPSDFTNPVLVKVTGKEMVTNFPRQRPIPWLLFRAEYAKSWRLISDLTNSLQRQLMGKLNSSRLGVSKLSLVFALVFAIPHPSVAQEAPAPAATEMPAAAGPRLVMESSAAEPYWSNRGHWTFGFQAGYMVENDIPNNISHINLLIAQP